VGKDKKHKNHQNKEKGPGKHHKNHQASAPSAPASTPTAVLTPLTGDPTYADGTPLDSINYLEAKLILKPEPFTSVDAFRDFGKIVQRMAKKCGVGFLADPETQRRPQIREITFGDTSDFRLYNNAFILRRRISYVDGFAVGDPEIVFKFRHPDQQMAANFDVRPNIAGKYRIKFKAEALPLRDRVGSYRILYSHNCQFGLSQMHEEDKTSMATLAKVFPGLKSIRESPIEHIILVNEGIVEEVLLPLGELDFGKGMVGKCDISLWRTRGEHKQLVGEFAFQAQFPRREDVAIKSKQLATQFYVALQNEVKDWLALGVTKTAMVYRLKGNPPQSHE
jgi:uncharacterized protein (UPF0303 family)